MLRSYNPNENLRTINTTMLPKYVRHGGYCFYAFKLSCETSIDVFYFFLLKSVALIPWVPEAFHSRFPVSVIRLRRSCLRPVGLPATDEAPRRTLEKTSGTYST